MRLGETHFKNTDFIYHAIRSGAVECSGIELVKAHPPELARLLLSGKIDAAPTSSIMYALHPEELAILEGLSISAPAGTGSILVFSRCASCLKELRGKRIATTSTSASSVALLRILLREKGIDAKLVVNHPPRLGEMLRIADAALLIGDHALVAGYLHPELVVADLGEEWRSLTGLPMVYALWLVTDEFARRTEMVEELKSVLVQARRYAYEHLHELARVFAEQLGIPARVMREHLRCLDYNLSSRNLRGLKRFFELASRHGIIPSVPELRFAGGEG